MHLPTDLSVAAGRAPAAPLKAGKRHPAFIPRPLPIVAVHSSLLSALTCAFVHPSPPQTPRPAFGTLRSPVRIRPSRLRNTR